MADDDRWSEPGSILRHALSWKLALEAEGKRPRTVGGYLDTIELFDRWQRENGGSTQLGALYIGGFLNDNIRLGIGGATIIDKAETQSDQLENLSATDFWYAGAHAGYVFAPHNVVNLEIELLAGGGSLDINRVDRNGNENSNLIVLEPGVNLRFNISQTVTLGVSGSYRWIDNVDVEGLESGDLAGAAAGIYLEFTEF